MSVQITQVVADSGIYIAAVTPEPLSSHAKGLLKFWGANPIQIVAPTLFRYEIVAVIRKQVYRKLLTSEEAIEVHANLRRAVNGVTFMVDDVLLERGYALVEKLGRPTAYDSQYLAVAESLNCEFWTADERLFNAVKNDFPWIRWLGNFNPST